MKGQLQHTFTFIMLILLAGVVLLFGYRMIGGDGGILSKSCAIEELKLKQQIEDYLDSYSKYGTYQQKTLLAPCDAQQLCFADVELFGEPNSNGVYEGSTFSFGDSVIAAEIQTPSTPPNNVFLVDKNGATVPLQLWSEKVKIVPQGVLCVNATSGSFRLTFKGEGLKTKIERT